MLGVSGTPEYRDGMIEPHTAHGLKVMSVGLLTKANDAMIWRGPMASQALTQMLTQTRWGTEAAPLDILVVDLPPGTGDVQLTMIQKHKPAGAVIVSTPQDLALMDATRAISLFEQADVPIIGLVENMAGYACPHCGEVSDPFGTGGVERFAAALEIPFLGRVPLTLATRIAGDRGEPPAAGDDETAEPFRAIAPAVFRPCRLGGCSRDGGGPGAIGVARAGVGGGRGVLLPATGDLAAHRHQLEGRRARLEGADQPLGIVHMGTGFGVLEDGFADGQAGKRLAQVHRLALVAQLLGATGVLRHVADQRLGVVHQVAVVPVGRVELHHGELGVVAHRDAFVAEVAVDLEHALKPTHQQALEVQLGRDAQEHFLFERVVVCDERLGIGIYT